MKKSIFFNRTNKDKIAKFLKTSPEALKRFEDSYSKMIITEQIPENFFSINAKQAAEQNKIIEENESDVDEDTLKKVKKISERIVNELIELTPIIAYDGESLREFNGSNISIAIDKPVTKEEILELPEFLRPELSGYLMKTQISGQSYIELVDSYMRFIKEKNISKKTFWYNHFRQGLDILDIDPITYKMIDRNRNSMSHWFPQIVKAAQKQKFFKIPKTTIIKIPESLLQLTRLDYCDLSETTIKIVDDYCMKVFDLDINNEYFIKTGTYSSKYDFRNAYVHGAKEVKELGEYLLFIHFQALQMAAMTNNVSIYGVSTTTEWVVRDFIKDKENNPKIYEGLPLHTEYRAFVDFDTKEILGITPYWDEKVMKNNFSSKENEKDPHKMHDYIIFSAHNEVMMKRYNTNIEVVKQNLQVLINNTENLKGQWSIDIMQNEDDFWIIDMALAVNSALKNCVPNGKLKKVEEDWLPLLKEK